MLGISMESLEHVLKRSAKHWNKVKIEKLQPSSKIIVVRKTFTKKYRMSSVHATCTPINWPTDSQKYDIYINEESM